MLSQYYARCVRWGEIILTWYGTSWRRSWAEVACSTIVMKFDLKSILLGTEQVGGEAGRIGGGMYYSNEISFPLLFQMDNLCHYGRHITKLGRNDV